MKNERLYLNLSLNENLECEAACPICQAEEEIKKSEENRDEVMEERSVDIELTLDREPEFLSAEEEKELNANVDYDTEAEININVKDRAELAKIIKQAKESQKSFIIKRSLDEGYRYSITLKDAIKESLTEGINSMPAWFELDPEEELKFNKYWAKEVDPNIKKYRYCHVMPFEQDTNGKWVSVVPLYGGSYSNGPEFVGTRLKDNKLYVKWVDDSRLLDEFSDFFTKQNQTRQLRTDDIKVKDYLKTYIEMKKDKKQELDRQKAADEKIKKSASYRGTKSVLDLSDTEKAEALDWFKNNIESINIKYPTGLPNKDNYINLYDNDEVLDIKIDKFENKFKIIKDTFFKKFNLNPKNTSGNIDKLGKVHYEPRNASKLPAEKALDYYKFWGLVADIYFKTKLSEAPEVVKSLINKAKNESTKAGSYFDETDTTVSSIYLLYALKTLVNDNWDILNESIEKEEEHNQKENLTEEIQESLDDESNLSLKGEMAKKFQPDLLDAWYGEDDESDIEIIETFSSEPEKEKFKQNFEQALEAHDEYVGENDIDEFIRLNYDNNDLKSWGYAEFKDFVSEIAANWGDFWGTVKGYDLNYPASLGLDDEELDSSLDIEESSDIINFDNLEE